MYGSFDGASLTITIQQEYAPSCYPFNSKEHVNYLILKVGECFKRCLDELTPSYQNLNEILGPTWSQYINEMNQKFPLTFSKDSATKITPYYVKFIKEFNCTQNQCIQIKSLIESSPYLLVLPNQWCVDIEGKKLPGIFLKGEIKDKRIRELFEKKMASLNLQFQYTQHLKIYGISEDMMQHLESVLDGYNKTSYRSFSDYLGNNDDIPLDETIPIKPRNTLKQDSACCLIL